MSSTAPLRVARIDTPLGSLVAACAGPSLCVLAFESPGSDPAVDAPMAKPQDTILVRFPAWDGAIIGNGEGDPVLAPLRAALARYFAGTVEALDRLPVEPGGTPFQRGVWTALRAIAAGQTRSYGEIARTVGSPGGARAVGQAIHHNPVALVIPCHRIIGARGELVGWGGGISRKRWLLEHEHAAGVGTRSPTLPLPLRRRES